MSVLGSFGLSLLFVAFSAAGWWLANGGVIAREEGFDPLRYEYLARSELPEYLADSSSYTIVIFLKFIYQFLPEYLGFIAVIILCLFFVLTSNNERSLRAATISPIAFFYFGQTGKDGLAILAIAAIIVIAIQNIKTKLAPLVAIIILALFIRPALILLLPSVFLLFKAGNRWSIFCAIALSALFLLTTDSEATLLMVEGVASDDTSGPLALFGREFTFGYSLRPIIGRAILFFVSPLIQPIGSVFKAINSGEFFIYLEGFCQLIFLIILIRNRVVSNFLLNSIPFVIIISTASPFYHFRYIAVIYPGILAYTMWQKSKQRRQRF